jgi:peptidyl-prolyl cis-trans isomerase D
MLRGLQNATRNWLGRVVMAILFGLIAVSFAIWGIGDIFRGFGRSTVAKIGRTELTIENFRQTYNERVQQLSRQVGRPITPDQARALGLHRQLLGQLLAESALDEDARVLRLGLSDAEIARQIRSDPSFRGLTGQFDRARFDAIIRQAGYNEGRYVAEQRRVLLRRQIGQALSGGVTAPAVAIEAQNRFVNEERSVEFVMLQRSDAGEVPAPAPDVLAKYFEDRKTLFRAPEYRKLDLIVLTPTEVARWIEISDADVKKAYDERRQRYVTPERRELRQIVFQNPDEARAAAERLEKGLTFDQLAAERNLKDADVTLGSVAKSAILDRAVADAAFALQPGQTSAPVQGRFGTVIVRLIKIEPEKVRGEPEVATELKRDLALERAKAQITGLHDKIEDERGSGLPLAKIADKLKVTTQAIAAVDRSGRDPNGNPVTTLPAGVDVMSNAFASDVGVENEPVQVPGGGYVWYEVESVTPSRERPLDEIKDRVLERWRDQQIAERLKAKAGELVDKLKTSGIAEVAKAAGLKEQKASGLKRNQPTGGVPAGAVDEIFRAAKDAVGSSEGESPAQWIVFKLTDITVPKLDPESADAKRLQDNLRNAYAEDLIAQYIGRLQTELGATINEAALNQVIGGATN